MLAFVIQNHSHRAGEDLGRELVGRLACHRSTFSGVGASDQPGAVQIRALAANASSAPHPKWMDRQTGRLKAAIWKSELARKRVSAHAGVVIEFCSGKVIVGVIGLNGADAFGRQIAGAPSQGGNVIAAPEPPVGPEVIVSEPRLPVMLLFVVSIT